MDKVKQEKVIIITVELLTGNELVEVIKEHKLENHLIEKIERQAEFENPIWDKQRGCNMNKITGYSYVYVFIDKERVKNG